MCWSALTTGLGSGAWERRGKDAEEGRRWGIQLPREAQTCSGGLGVIHLGPWGGSSLQEKSEVTLRGNGFVLMGGVVYLGTEMGLHKCSRDPRGRDDRAGVTEAFLLRGFLRASA